MAFRAYTSNHLSTGDGGDYQKILSSQQGGIRVFVSVGCTLRTNRMPDFLSCPEVESVITVDTTPRLLI